MEVLEPAFTKAEQLAVYNVHVRITWKAAAATRSPIHYGLTLSQAEELFERYCNRVVNNRYDQVETVEVKQGRRVLFMNRFKDGVRL